MHDLLIAACVIALTRVVEVGVRRWLRRDRDARIAEAHKVLARHGMDAHFYLAGFGAKDEELRQALHVIEATGKIVLDANGRVVGRVLPTEVKGPHLCLVVDNT